jgi:hypothetical protein
MFARFPSLSEMRIRSSPYYHYTIDDLVGEPTSDLYFPVFDPDPIHPKLVGAVNLEVIDHVFRSLF